MVILSRGLTQLPTALVYPGTHWLQQSPGQLFIKFVWMCPYLAVSLSFFLEERFVFGIRANLYGKQRESYAPAQLQWSINAPRCADADMAATYVYVFVSSVWLCLTQEAS